MKMDWSKEHVLQLIELVRRRPCLYNVELESFLNKKERIRAASEMAKQLSHLRPGTTIEEVLKKWDELCAQFLTKHEHILQSRRGSVSRPFYYDKMSFVLDYISPKPSPKLLLEKRDDKDQSTLKCLFEKMTWSQSGQLFMPRLRLAVLTSQFSTRRISPQRIAAPFYSPRLLQPGPYSRVSTMGMCSSSQSERSGTPAAAAQLPQLPPYGSPPSLWMRCPGNSSARITCRHGSARVRPRPPRERGHQEGRCSTTPFRTRHDADRTLSTDKISGDASPLTASDKSEPASACASAATGSSSSKGGRQRHVECGASATARASAKNRPSSEIVARAPIDLGSVEDCILLPGAADQPSDTPPAEPSTRSGTPSRLKGIPLRSNDDSLSCFSFQSPKMNSSGGSLPSQKRGTSDALLSSIFASSSRDHSSSSVQDIRIDELAVEDEDSLYMKYLLCRLRKLDEGQKVRLKFEIDKLFYQMFATCGKS